MPKPYVLAFMVALTLAAGCHLVDFHDGPGPGPAMEPIRMLDTPRMDSLASDPARIEAAEVRGDVLRLKVTYGGGCAEHDFALYGWRAFMESYPVQAQVLLVHDGHDDACDALLTRDLRFDLTPLKEAYRAGYGAGEGRIRLRIYPPGPMPSAEDPFQPLPNYYFD